MLLKPIIELIPGMKKFFNVEKKGKLAWMIPLFDTIIGILFVIGCAYGAYNCLGSIDFAGIFEAIYTLVWFLLISTIITTLLTFLPIFASKRNRELAIWNIIYIIWLILVLTGVI